MRWLSTRMSVLDSKILDYRIHDRLLAIVIQLLTSGHRPGNKNQRRNVNLFSKPIRVNRPVVRSAILSLETLLESLNWPVVNRHCRRWRSISRKLILLPIAPVTNREKSTNVNVNNAVGCVRVCCAQCCVTGMDVVAESWQTSHMILGSLSSQFIRLIHVFLGKQSLNRSFICCLLWICFFCLLFFAVLFRFSRIVSFWQLTTTYWITRQAFFSLYLLLPLSHRSCASIHVWIVINNHFPTSACWISAAFFPHVLLLRARERLVGFPLISRSIFISVTNEREVLECL